MSSAHALSRRATTSASRRVPRYLTSSTLWYSGIFATAATLDARRKEERREQWDRAIADLKNELEQLNHAATTASESAVQPQQKHTDKLRLANPKTQHLWPTNAGAPLRVHRLAPESIYATWDRKARAAGQRWSAKKLATMEVWMDILQLEIMSDTWQNVPKRGWARVDGVPDEYLHHLGLFSKPCPSRAEWDMGDERSRALLESRLKRSSRLRMAAPDLSDYTERESGGYSICRYSQDDLDQAQEDTDELNMSLRELFRMRESGRISTPVTHARIAYYLALTSGPPNVNTFNTLLLGLARPEDRRVTGYVIKALRETHIRPNELTITAVLEHYTRTEDFSGFTHWIQLMRGKHNGLALARHDIHINEAGRGRLLAKDGEPWKIIQLPYSSPIVFGSVIEGVLKFGGFDAAIRTYQAMAPEGWGLCMTGYTALLEECAKRNDWYSGWGIWRLIQQLEAKSRRWTGTGWESERINFNTYAYMLRLCLNCDQPTAFNDILKRAKWVFNRRHEELLDLVNAGATSRDVRTFGLCREQTETGQAKSQDPIPASEPSTTERLDTPVENPESAAFTELCEGANDAPTAPEEMETEQTKRQDPTFASVPSIMN